MSEQKTEGDMGELLSSKLFEKAFRRSAGDLLAGVQRALDTGDEAKVNELLMAARKNLANAVVNTISPGLTDQENEELLRLRDRRYTITDDGLIDFNDIDERSERRLDYLER